MSSPALSEAIVDLVSWRTLSSERSHAAVRVIIDGDADASEIAAFLTALHFRGVDSPILKGASDAVLERMVPFEVAAELRPILDTCGTGGDGYKSVNISTAAAIVVAACGVRVAKHGNRSASGNSGSAEVLQELGVRFDAEPIILERCLSELGITFLFAPNFHRALKHAAVVRKRLPFRTLFNLIGPLVNPARPDFQIIGVPDRERAKTIVGVLETEDLPNRSRPSAYVVTAHSGLDEVTLSGTTHVLPTYDEAHSWEPGDFGLPQTAESDLIVTGPEDSAGKIRAMLAGERGPVRDFVLANVSAALKLVGKVDTLAEGVARGAQAIDRGDARWLLERWAVLSHS